MYRHGPRPVKQTRSPHRREEDSDKLQPRRRRRRRRRWSRRCDHTSLSHINPTDADTRCYQPTSESITLISRSQPRNLPPRLIWEACGGSIFHCLIMFLTITSARTLPGTMFDADPIENSTAGEQFTPVGADWNLCRAATLKFITGRAGI